MAEAILLTEETTNAVVDEVRAHGKDHGEVGELSYWTDHYHCTSAETQWKTLGRSDDGQVYTRLMSGKS